MVTTLTRDEALAALQAITREIEENRFTIQHDIIDMDRNVIASYRKTVRWPRGESQQGEQK